MVHGGGRRLTTAGLDLDNSDSDSEEEKSKPFGRGELFPKKDDGKGGCGQNLHLVTNLESGGIEV